MDKHAAMARLGLEGTEDVAAIARVYGERLSAAQQALVDAKTKAKRQRAQVELAELVEAYQVLTHPSLQDESATQVRLPESPPPAMRPGVVLSDRFVIKALLGQGGMGNVYAAHDRLKQQDVAIKVLRQDLLASPSARERFLAEAKVSCDLSHPNIVRVYDVGSSDGYYYLSMELLKGCTLRQRMQSSTSMLPIDAITDIAAQLIEALRHAHRTIVHRDIKPENIWLAEDGTLKLMDFGIARAYSASNLTMTGMSLGTAYYMAPEQRLAAKEVDWRADQYSVGIVLYELLTGTVPMGAAKCLRELRPDLPKRYALAVMRAIEPRPQERLDSMQELLLELQAPRPGPLRVKVALVAAGAVLSVLAIPAYQWDVGSSAGESAALPGPEVRAAAPMSPPIATPVGATETTPSETAIDAEIMAAISPRDIAAGEAANASEAAGGSASDASTSLEPAVLPEMEPPPFPREDLPPPRDELFPPPQPPSMARAKSSGKEGAPNKCVMRCQRVEGDCHHEVVTTRDQCIRVARPRAGAECRMGARRGEQMCIKKGQDCRSSCR